MAASSCSSPAEQSSEARISSSADQGTMATAVGALSADEEHFMYHFKVLPCPLTEEHCQEECPYAHPAEKATRRDPRVYPYTGVSCPSYRKGSCKDGDACQYAHGVFEVWLHPSRFRTELCKDGPSCTRKCCFFAHTTEQLRKAPPKDPSIQALAAKAQKAALTSRSTNSSSSGGSGGFYAGAKTTSSLSSSDSASSSMLRAAVRNAYSPANGSSASGKQALYSRASTPAHGSCNSLQQLEALAGSAYSAQAGAGNSAGAAASALFPQSSTRFVLQQASYAAALTGFGSSMAAAASAPQIANGASRMLFDLTPSADSAFAGSGSGGFGAQKPPHGQNHGQNQHMTVGSLQGHAGQSCGLEHMDLLAGNFPASTISAGGLPVSAGLGLSPNGQLSHSCSTGYAAAAALELLAAQQQDVTAACMLQQLLLNSQQQQQQQQLLLEAQKQHQQQDQQQGHLFQMWSAAFNAAKGVGLQPKEAAACADCAVEQAVGTLVPQLVDSTASSAPFLQASAAPAAAPGLFGAVFGGKDVSAPGYSAFGHAGFSAPAQQGLQAALQQQMLLMHATADMKQGSGGFAQADGLMGGRLGDVLAGMVSGLSV